MSARTPVLIVGGGPVGLALAGELGWRGVACTLIEKTDCKQSVASLDCGDEVGVKIGLPDLQNQRHGTGSYRCECRDDRDERRGGPVQRLPPLAHAALAALGPGDAGGKLPDAESEHRG